MTISVIIPAYNEEKNIPIIVNALRKQTSKNFEVIIVDNNSTDKSYQVAKRLADKVCSCKIQGISPTRNFGAKKAKGEIIAFLDADSLPSPIWIEQIEKHFAQNPKLSAMSGLDTYEYYDFFNSSIINAYSYIIFHSLDIMNKYGKSMITANNLAIKKEIFDAVGGFDHFVVEDYYLGLKLRKAGAKCKMNPHMKVELSSRRIQKMGAVRTCWEWLIPLFKKIPSEQYSVVRN